MTIGGVMPVALNPLQPAFIDRAPRQLGWRLPADWCAQRQAAYDLEVSTSGDFAAGSEVWRSGRVESDKTQHVAYAGPALKSHQRYFWRVTVWGDRGDRVASDVSWWETAKLTPADWRGEMIGPQTDPGAEGRSPTLFRQFELAAAPQTARLYITSFGVFRCFINGRRVGNDELTPGWTSYRDRLGYLSYDVADLLQAGANRIEVWLGDGWYRGELCWPVHRVTNAYGSRVGCLADLRIGSGDDAEIIATDTSWSSGLAPVLSSGIYPGEVYDARLEGDESEVRGADLLPLDKATLVAQEAPPIRELPQLLPVSRTELAPNVTLVDFGQNAAGVIRLTVTGEAGATAKVNFAEILDAEGKDLNGTSFRAAKVELDYTLKGGGEESYQPYFTFMGFRYARVTLTGNARLVSITSVPLTSDLTVAGQFSCGNPLINRLHENASWSLRSNFLDVPMDCPQRDERLGWTGDAQIFSPTASYLRDSAPFFKKWLRDMVADQRDDGAVSHVVPHPNRYNEAKMPNFYGSAGWGDAMCAVPWTVWTFTGDKDVLEDNLDGMVKWIEYLTSMAPDGIRHPPILLTERGFTFGDWVQPQGSTVKPNPNCGDDFMATAFYYASTVTTAKAARIVGRADIAETHEALAKKIKAAFQAEFFTSTGRLAYNSQGAHVFALMHDLVPEQFRDKTIAGFEEAIYRTGGMTSPGMQIGTGVMATPILLPTLSKVGLHDTAIKLLLTETSPGWLYQVKRGATTIWERWDGIDLEGTPAISMNSYNHYAYGAVVFWFYHHLAGIQPVAEAPGFESILLAPEFHAELAPLNAAHETRYGAIEAGWSMEGDRVTYRFTTPPGTRTHLKLPANAVDIALDQRPLGRDEAGATTGDGLAVEPGARTVTMRLAA